jgi:hypothetical protein
LLETLAGAITGKYQPADDAHQHGIGQRPDEIRHQPEDEQEPERATPDERRCQRLRHAHELERHPPQERMAEDHHDGRKQRGVDAELKLHGDFVPEGKK